MGLANLQEGWFYSTTGQGCISHSTICKPFWLLHDLMLLRRVWQHDFYSCPFQVTNCTGSTPSTSSHWTETPPIFLSIHWVWKEHKTQHQSPDNADLKGNTSFLWPHCSCRCSRHTARSLKMHSWAACAGPQQKASACQKAIWFVFVSKWLIICGQFCFFSLFTLLKHVITARYLAGISYLFSIMSDTSLKFKSNAGVQHLIRFYPITITSSP